MKMMTRSRSRVANAPEGIAATVRLDRHVGQLARRLKPGEIAVIDQVDLDRVTAQALSPFAYTK